MNDKREIAGHLVANREDREECKEMKGEKNEQRKTERKLTMKGRATAAGNEFSI